MSVPTQNSHNSSMNTHFDILACHFVSNFSHAYFKAMIFYHKFFCCFP